MTTKSAAAAFTIDPHPQGMHKAVELSKKEAIEKLGGEEGLVCHSAITREDGKINVVWKRNWEEPDRETETPDATDEPA